MVHVHQMHPPALPGQQHAKGCGGGGLTHSPFLIHYGKNIHSKQLLSGQHFIKAEFLKGGIQAFPLSSIPEFRQKLGQPDGQVKT
jgi:hypothetical protein